MRPAYLKSFGLVRWKELFSLLFVPAKCADFIAFLYPTNVECEAVC